MDGGGGGRHRRCRCLPIRILVIWVIWEVDPAPIPQKPSPLLRKRAITHLGDCLPKKKLHQIWILSHLGSWETEFENFFIKNYNGAMPRYLKNKFTFLILKKF